MKFYTAQKNTKSHLRLQNIQFVHYRTFANFFNIERMYINMIKENAAVILHWNI